MAIGAVIFGLVFIAVAGTYVLKSLADQLPRRSPSTAAAARRVSIERPDVLLTYYNDTKRDNYVIGSPDAGDVLEKRVLADLQKRSYSVAFRGHTQDGEPIIKLSFGGDGVVIRLSERRDVSTVVTSEGRSGRDYLPGVNDRVFGEWLREHRSVILVSLL